MALKSLYSFTIDQEKEIEKTHTRKNKKTGEETTVTKKVKEKAPIEVFIKRPSRRELEDAELEYSVEPNSSRLPQIQLTKNMKRMMQRHSVYF